MKPPISVKRTSEPVVVIGGAAMDVICQQSTPRSSGFNDSPTTVPGEIKFFAGGVARNIAEAAHRILNTSKRLLETPVMLISPLADDHAGQALVADCDRLGMRTDGLLFKPGRTAICSQILDLNGDLLTGVADMSIMEATEFGQVHSTYFPLIYIPQPILLYRSYLC